jgi:hypothetical protein
MKLLSLLFAGTLLLPSAVSAETWWLIIAGSHVGGMIIEKVPMESEEQCNAAGDIVYNSRDLEPPNDVHNLKVIPSVRYICVLGK